jgi:hypothetical protein
VHGWRRHHAVGDGLRSGRKVPLSNVDVFIPNAALAQYTDGPACDTCAMALSGSPVVRTKTDTAGHFTLGNSSADVPVGSNIPLVIQVGRWRREATISTVAACADTAVAADVARLPRNQSEGHLPKIALTTGGVDALECLLRKIGISDSEFTPESGGGRVNFFAGIDGTNKFNAALGGANFTPVVPWWDDAANLRKYDMILHSCDGQENPNNKSMAARMALQQYADVGGRVFASHWHNYWFEHGPAPWPTIANFDHQADLGDSVHSDDRHQLHARRRAGPVAGERGWLDDARPARDSRRAAHHQHRRHRPAVDLQHESPIGSVPGRDHAVPGRRLRARGAQRHSRVDGWGVGDGGRFQSGPGLSRRLSDDGPVAAGEDAGVHDLRPLVLHRDHRLTGLVIIGKVAGGEGGERHRDRERLGA